MIHCGRGPGFPDEPAPERLIGRQRGCEDLERDLAFQPLIVGAEHHRHAALADLLLQPVPGHPRPRGHATRQSSALRYLIVH